jgi:hypothetical protein
VQVDPPTHAGSATHLGSAADVGPADGRIELPSAVDALDFLLETLGKDLQDLIRVLQGPR